MGSLFGFPYYPHDLINPIDYGRRYGRRGTRGHKFTPSWRRHVAKERAKRRARRKAARRAG